MGPRRKIALTLFSIAVTTATLWIVFRQFEWNTFATQLSTMDWRWIATAVAADIASYIAQGVRWSLLLNRQASIALTTRAVYAGLFLNEVLPMRPGEVLRGWIVARKTNLTIGPILRSMLAERIIDTAILLAAAMWTASFVPLPFNIPKLAIIAVPLIWIAASLWFAPLRNPTAVLASSAILLGQCAAVWCTLRACGLPLTPAAGIAITVILRIGTAIPVAPANAGTHQVSMLAALALFGITGPPAAGAALIVFATLTLPLLVLGAGSFTASKYFEPQSPRPHRSDTETPPVVRAQPV